MCACVKLSTATFVNVHHSSANPGNRLIMESEAEAEAEILRGEAEAFSIEAKAKAEAEKMAKKADAWKEYKEAAMLDMMLESMPKVTTDAAARFSD